MLDKNQLYKIDDFLMSQVEAGQIPGAVYGIVTKNATLAENAIGLSHMKRQIPMQLDTIFDLASLTKVCVTTPGILLLIQNGLIDPDDSIKRFYPEAFSDEITIKHLLTHTSGLPAHIPFYKYGWTKEKILSFIIGNDFVIGNETRPGKKVVYSDLNYILLGLIIEKISGKTLDQFAQESIFAPLELLHTSFNPTENKMMIAPTEWIESKQDYQWGEVHDENAYHLGGVSGHAGLFSNLHDLKVYVQMLLRDGQTKSGESLIASSILQASRKNYTYKLNLNRGLGWQLVDDAFSPLGYFLSKESYGHTGFTGTSFWIDPEREIGVILLSNRVHISRSINMNRIRRVVHNLVATSVH